MRNYTHTRGGLSKLEYDEVAGAFVTTLSPEMPAPETDATSTVDIIPIPGNDPSPAATQDNMDRKVG